MTPAPSLESESARFRLFDAATTFVKQAASAQPPPLLLDDLHWADLPSLRLLEFAAAELLDARVLIVGTYREVEHHGDDHRIRNATRQSNTFGAAIDDCDLERSLGSAGLGSAAHVGIWLYRNEGFNGRRTVVGEVQSGPHADFDDVAMGTRDDLIAKARAIGALLRAVHEVVEC